MPELSSNNVVGFSKRSRLSEKRLQGIIDEFLSFLAENFQKPRAFYKGWLISCPFHNDTDPSLAIYRDGSTWCFSCKKAYKLEAVLKAYKFWEGEAEEDPELKPDFTKLEKQGEEDWIILDHKQYLYTDGERVYIRVRIDWENIKTRKRDKDFYFYRPVIKDGKQDFELIRGLPPLILYRLLDIKDKQEVFFVEGEKCVDALWDLGLPATTLPIGGKTKVNRELIEALLPLRGKTVYILPDNDDVGWEYAKIINQALNTLGAKSQIIPVPKLWEKSDIADFIELESLKGRTKEEIKAEILSWCEPKGKIVSFWEAMQAEQERGFNRFIVPGLFPAKGLGLLVGRSKLGKTELLCLIVSKLLRGEPLFDRPSEKVKVLWITQEDTTVSIGERLMLRGITPQELQEDLFTVEVGEETTITKDLLIEEAKRLGCQVVIVEPLLAIKELADLGIKDRLTYGAVYSVLLPLKKKAGEEGIFILGVHHANKGKSIFRDWTDVIDGALGSTAFSGVPDCIIGIGLTSSGDQSLRRVLAKGRGVDLDYLIEWTWQEVEMEGEKLTFGKYVEKEEYSFEFDLTSEQKRLIDAIRELEARGEEATPKRLAQELGKTENAVKLMLMELLDRGVIEKAKRGVYFVKTKERNFGNFPNFRNFRNFPNFGNFPNFPQKSFQKFPCPTNFQSLENSGLEGKVSKVSKVSSVFNPTSDPDLGSKGEPLPLKTSEVSKPDLKETDQEEEYVYLLMSENRCSICDWDIWRVEKKVYTQGRGVALCLKCKHLEWFGDFTKGRVLTEEDLQFYLCRLISVEAKGTLKVSDKAGMQ